MKVPNNADKIAAKINAEFNQYMTQDAVSDDGAVIVHTKEKLLEYTLVKKYANRRIGDGVQEGGLFINGIQVA